VLALLRPPALLTFGLIAFAGSSCYAFLSVNHGLLRFGIVSYVVLLFALTGLPEPVMALHRTVATPLSGIIALAAHALWRWLAQALNAEWAWF
jgi:hypothetical protein